MFFFFGRVRAVCSNKFNFLSRDPSSSSPSLARQSSFIAYRKLKTGNSQKYIDLPPSFVSIPIRKRGEKEGGGGERKEGGASSSDVSIYIRNPRVIFVESESQIRVFLSFSKKSRRLAGGDLYRREARTRGRG